VYFQLLDDVQSLSCTCTALTDAYDVRGAVYIYFGSSNNRSSKTWPMCVHNYFSKERYAQCAGETAK